MPSQTKEQKRNAFQDAGVPLPSDTIGSSALTPVTSPVVPPPTPARDFSPFATASFESLLSDFNKPVAEEARGSNLQQSILDSLTTIGTEKSRKQTLEQEAGLPGQRKELQGVINQLQGLQKEALAIPLQIQQESEGRGRTAGGVAPIETGRLRENTIKSLGLAAIGQTLQGNITLANQTIQSALDAEFEPERQKLATLRELYTFNKDSLERIDKKRADNLNLVLNERSRNLAERRADKQFSSQLMLDAAKSGATPEVLEKMRESTPDEAIALGTKYFGAEFQRQAEQQAFENNIRTRDLAIKEAEFAMNQRTSLLTRANSGDPAAIRELGYDPRDVPISYEKLKSYETQKVNIEKDISDLQAALNNSVGLEASSGLLRGAISESVFGGSGTPFGVFAAPVVAQKRNSFMGTARYTVNNLTLQKVGELAEQGIKLTPIANEELRLMGQASKRLAAIGEYNDSGQLVGFTAPAEEVRTELNTILEHYGRALQDINVAMTVTEADKNEISKTK